MHRILDCVSACQGYAKSNKFFTSVKAGEVSHIYAVSFFIRLCRIIPPYQERRDYG